MWNHTLAAAKLTESSAQRLRIIEYIKQDWSTVMWLETILSSALQRSTRISSVHMFFKDRASIFPPNWYNNAWMDISINNRILRLQPFFLKRSVTSVGPYEKDIILMWLIRLQNRKILYFLKKINREFIRQKKKHTKKMFLPHKKVLNHLGSSVFINWRRRCLRQHWEIKQLPLFS